MNVYAMWLSAALASEDVDAPSWRAHQDAAAEAAEAERRADPEAAVRACEAAVEALPDGPRSAWCRERRAFLDARRDPDGGLDGWRGLELARRGGGDRASQRAAILALVEGEGIGEGVRREAFGWLADDAWTRLRDPAEAWRWSAPLVALPDLPLEEMRRYRILHARILAGLGRWEEADAVEAEVLVLASGRRLSPVQVAQRDARRVLATRAAEGVLGLFAVSAVARAVRRRRDPVGPGGVPLVVGWGSAAAIAVAWEASNDALVLSIGAGLAGTFALAWLGGSGRGGDAWFRVLAALSAPAVVGWALAWHGRLEEIGW
jgi:hypothetical protein